MKTIALVLLLISGAVGCDASAESNSALPAGDFSSRIVNPAEPVLFVANHVEQVSFGGWLAGASGQTSTRYRFDVSLPYELSEDRGNIILRATVPYYFNEPIPLNHDDYLTVNSRFGDANFDVYWGKTNSRGLIFGAGVRGTAPVATNANLGKKLWGLGPRLTFGQQWHSGILGASISHQWDIAGEGGDNNDSIDLSELQYFYAIELGQGWQVSAEPLASYDHSAAPENRLTLPAGVGIARAVRWAGMPWRFHMQYWNYLEANDMFAPKHQLRFSMTPIFNAPWN